MRTFPVSTLLALMALAGCLPSTDGLSPQPELGGLWDPAVTSTPRRLDAGAVDPGKPGAPPPVAGPAPLDAAGNSAAVPTDPGPGRPCALTFTVTTASYNGSYAPENVGAIWIADAGDRFVKTLSVWAGKRRKHLDSWNSVSGGNTVDAVTAATARDHGARSGTWNCTGLDRRPVPDGTYRVNVEFTESNSAGRLMPPLDFAKTGGPVDLSPIDQGNFRSIHLQVIR
jgi:hypothetical protein